MTEVTAYERPTLFAFRGDSTQKYSFVYRFAPRADGTEVTVEAQFPRLPGLFALIPRRFLRRAIGSELKRNHLALKGSLSDDPEPRPGRDRSGRGPIPRAGSGPSIADSACPHRFARQTNAAGTWVR